MAVAAAAPAPAATVVERRRLGSPPSLAAALLAALPARQMPRPNPARGARGSAAPGAGSLSRPRRRRRLAALALPALPLLLPPLLLLLLLLAALLGPGALAQVAVPQGIVSPIWQCPSGADIVPGKPTSYQTFCAQEFAVCMANPEMTVGGPYTALTVRAQTCSWCYADAWACYSDCPKPGFPLGWAKTCTDLCAPDFSYVCSGEKPPVT